jgi:hypothetical protein
MHPSPALRWLIASLLLALAAYSALGILQALSISQGERAIWNINFWASGGLLATVLAWLVAPIRSHSTQRGSIAHRLVPWVHFAIALAAAWSVLGHLFAVDACLDRGGSYNYLISSCSLVETSQSMPLHQSHGFPMTAAVVFTLLGLRSLRAREALPSRTSSAA